MNRRLSRLFTIVLTAMLLCCSVMLNASAHNCLAAELGGTYLQFSYSDGTLVKGAKVIIQDDNGENLGVGKTDSDGIYNYAEYAETASLIIMNDGEGHVCEYEVPDELPPVTDRTPSEEKTPLSETPQEEIDTQPGGMSSGTIIAIVVVVVAAVVVALFFSKRGKNTFS